MTDPGALADTHLHRAVRTTALGERRGRDALIADEIAAVAAGITVRSTTDVGAMRVERLGVAGGEWARHVWSVREGAWVARETVIEDGMARCTALALDPGRAAAETASGYLGHGPLGELRAGTGQGAAAAGALLPADFPDVERDLADVVHRLWNGRRLDALAAWSAAVDWSGPGGLTGDRDDMRAWVVALLARYPDAVLLFEAATAAGDTTALLWRLHGHSVQGDAVRLIGSSVVTRDTVGRITRDATLIDGFAAAVQERAAQFAY